MQLKLTTNSATLSQLIFIIRYESGGNINDRFVYFILLEDHSEEDVSEVIFHVLNKLRVNKMPESYDGTPVMSDPNSEVQFMARAKYHNALFV